ncbi:hypothetical protein ACHQM5_002294 [Ranunculus cassubicifolius]
MDDAERNNNLSRHSTIHHQTLNPSSHRLRSPAQNTSYGYGDDTEDDDDEEIVEDYANSDDNDVDEDIKDDYNGGIEQGYRKKPKRNSFDSGYNFTRKASSEWTDHTTSVLLDTWGDRFLQFGRRSLRSEEWHDISKKVSQAGRIVKTDGQCRRRLDTLLKIYKKEKMKEEEDGGYVSSWVYFKKMDMLMSCSSSVQKAGLFCGLDSGEYVFMNPSVYLNCSNGFDEMKDSPENSESWDGEGRSKEDGDEASSFRLLADSINKFGEIYQKIEESKRQQMHDLEKMRMEFQRDLELQRRQMLERAQAEMEKMQQHEEEEEADEENVSVENTSG